MMEMRDERPAYRLSKARYAHEKVYIDVYPTRSGEPVPKIRVTDSKGMRLPGLLLTQDPDRYTIVMADLAIRQVVEISSEGSPFPFSLSIMPHIGMARPGVASTPVEIDERLRDDATTIRLTEVYETDDGEVLVGKILIPWARTRPPSNFPEINVIDDHGRSLVRTQASMRRVLVEECPDGSRTAHFAFTVKLLRKARRFVVVASPEDGSAPCGFATSCQLDIPYLRRRYEIIYRSSGQSARYHDWLLAHRASQLDLEVQRLKRIEGPVYSIVVPLFHTPLRYFREMVTSVINQTYGSWELILVDASPADRRLLDEAIAYADVDERVRLVVLEKNLGIAENTNAGIRAATGDFLCFLDHDDLLEPDCLYEYTRAIARQPETDLIFCDEDKFDGTRYFDGFFKPEFDWDLECSSNYVCHFLCVRRALVDQLDELPGSEFDGSQDHNLTLLVAEHARAIVHVPKVLYHWRMHRLSTSANPDTKPWTMDAGMRAVQGHLDRMGITGSVLRNPDVPNCYRIDYEIPESRSVSIVIPNKDAIDVLDRCLNSIGERTTWPRYEVIIVENNSCDPHTLAYYESLRGDSRINVIELEGPFNFSRLCNYGARHASSDRILFLNNDVEIITPDWLQMLMGPLERNDVAATGARLLYPEGLVQHAGLIIPQAPPVPFEAMLGAEDPGYFFLAKYEARGMSALTGACLMVDRGPFEAVGGFDESFPVSYNDVDLCLRLNDRGWRTVYCPYAELIHYESLTRGLDSETDERRRRLLGDYARFAKRWARVIALGDPAYTRHARPGSIAYELN